MTKMEMKIMKMMILMMMKNKIKTITMNMKIIITMMIEKRNTKIINEKIICYLKKLTIHIKFNYQF